MKKLTSLLTFATAAIIAIGSAGCQKKTTRKMEVETPNKKYEVEIEKTEPR